MSFIPGTKTSSSHKRWESNGGEQGLGCSGAWAERQVRECMVTVRQERLARDLPQRRVPAVNDDTKNVE